MLKRKALFFLLGVLICFGLTGCDREAPAISGIDSAVELDCGTDFNLKSYLIENVKITDETDDGIVNYNLSELEYTITCDRTAYNAETGELNTEKFGNYNVELCDGFYGYQWDKCNVKSKSNSILAT